MIKVCMGGEGSYQLGLFLFDLNQFLVLRGHFLGLDLLLEFILQLLLLSLDLQADLPLSLLFLAHDLEFRLFLKKTHK